MVGDPMVSASPGVLGGVSDCLSFRHGISRRTSILVRGHCAVERYERLRKTAGLPPFLGGSHAASDSPNREFPDSTVEQFRLVVVGITGIDEFLPGAVSRIKPHFESPGRIARALVKFKDG